MNPYVVIGGGPSGLACAWTLARAGAPVVVLERERTAGGLCGTVEDPERRGWRFDFGGHRFVSSDADLSRRVAAWLGDDLLVQERRSVVLSRGESFRYPLDALDLVSSLGVRENAVAFGGYVAARARDRVRPSPDVTFEDWVRARFGAPLYDRFFGPYTEKLWGIPAREIASEWAAQRIGLLHLGDAALRMMHLRRTPIRTYARKYLYPRLGMGQLFERIADDARAHGADLRFGAEATGLVVENGNVVAVRTSAGDLACTGVYSTMPLPTLARALGDDASALRFRAVRFVNLLLDRPSVSESTWMYVADPGFAIARIQEPRHRSPFMAPAGKTSLMLEVPCDAGDRTWNEDDASIVKRCLAELRTLGFDVERDVVGSFTTRVANGYPIYRVGYERHRDRALAAAARVRNLRTGGRQGLFRYVFFDAAMEMGSRAAQQLLEGGDPAAIDGVQRDAGLVEVRAITA